MNLDVFNQDAFSLETLTASINEVPYVPGRIGELGLFQEESISTLYVDIELQGNTLALVSSAERGSRGQQVNEDKRKMLHFKAIHLPQVAKILADEIQNVRAFGSQSEVAVLQNKVVKRLEKMRIQLDATIEYQRLGAIQGKIMDADGTTVLVDLFSEFGLTQQSQANVATATDVRTAALAAKRKSFKELGMARATGNRVFCGSDFFDALVSNADVKDAYARYNNGEMLRNDPRGGFMFANMIWEEYTGSVGDKDFIKSTEAYMVPEGVQDLFITRFAPADYVETVNTDGLPYYARQELMDMGKGVNLEAQSNIINLCTRPRAVIKMTK